MAIGKLKLSEDQIEDINRDLSDEEKAQRAHMQHELSEMKKSILDLKKKLREFEKRLKEK